MATDDQPEYARKVPPPGEIEQRSAAEWIAAGSAALSAGTQALQAWQNRKPPDPPPPSQSKDE